MLYLLSMVYGLGARVANKLVEVATVSVHSETLLRVWDVSDRSIPNNGCRHAATFATICEINSTSIELWEAQGASWQDRSDWRLSGVSSKFSDLGLGN